MVHRFAIARILERPAAIWLELEVSVLSRGDAPIDLGEACLKQFLQFRQMRLNRLAEDIQSSLGDQLVPCGPPQLLVDEIVLDTAEPHAVAAEDIAGIHAVAELAVQEDS